jgi:hypothetical protein
MLTGDGCFSDDRDDPLYNTSAWEACSPAVPFVVTASQYHADYEADSVVANLRYKGKLLKVIGTIRLVDKNARGEYYASLYADKEDFAAVDAVLSPDMTKEAASYHPGQHVELICVAGVPMGKIGLPGLCVRSSTTPPPQRAVIRQL